MNPAKLVYVGFCADLIHHGHINIIIVARKLGRVVVGLQTDRSIESYKRAPFMTYDQRKKVVENIIGVDQIIPMETWDEVDSIRKIKPDYFVHADDWKKEGSPLKKLRAEIIEALKGWGGKLIEPKYTEGVSSTRLLQYLLKGIKE